jgi:hypothetical protein
LRIDPYEDSDAYGRSASFIRVPGLADRSGVSFRLSDDPDAYVTHVEGRLRIRRTGRRGWRPERATFRIS